jgi:hypothetical protein
MPTDNTASLGWKEMSVQCRVSGKEITSYWRILLTLLKKLVNMNATFLYSNDWLAFA